MTGEAGSLDGWLVTPPAGRGPGLLLLQEIFGVNPHIRAVALQYALAGFCVLAPDLFWRQQRRVALGYVGDEREQALALMRQLQHEPAMADLRSALAVLRAHPACSGPVAALGYCMGGRLAYAAAAECGVDAAVCYYGGGIASRLDLAAQIRCPVLFHHAGHDSAIPAEAVDAVRGAMAGAPAASAAEFHLYPDAQHGFNCWARAAHHPSSAALALARTQDFLARHLLG